MTPRSAKNKGKRLQNEIAKIIRETFNLPVSDVKSTTMGETGTDIQLSAKAKDVFPYSVECKSIARIAIYKWWDQAKANTLDNTDPLLIIKQDRSEPLVVMSVDTFKNLIRE